MHVASSETTRAISVTPAAQAARAFASPEPSPSYSSHPQPASAGSSAGLRATELAASPVSPQAATEAAVLAMRSEPILSGGTHAREAHTDGSSLPPLPTVSNNTDFDPVPVVESPPVVEKSPRGIASFPAPVSIPTASVTVSQAVTQEPLNLSLPKAEPTAVNRSMPAVSRAIQQTDLSTAMAPQAPAMLRPLGAFSYTVPAAATRVPPSTDRYMPAIGFSPSRARVAREPPADPPAGPLLGHARKQSYTMHPLPAVPQQVTMSTSGGAPAVDKQEAFSVPAVSGSIMSAAPMALSMAHSSGAVYGPGVTSTPLAATTGLNRNAASITAAAPMQNLIPQTAPSVATYRAGPPPVLSPGQFDNPPGHLQSPMRQLQATDTSPADVAQLPTPTHAAGIGFGPSPVLATGLEAAPFSPPVSPAGPRIIPVDPTLSAALSQCVCVPSTPAETASSAASVAASAAPASAELSGAVFTAPYAANLVLTPGRSIPGGLLPGGLASGSLGIAPGPLQAGQTAVAGPVAEGTEHSLQALDLDTWSDADSVMAESLTQTWHRHSTQPGPVCEGAETHSDVWSDSASSDPGTPISGSQAMVGVPYCSCKCLLLRLLPTYTGCCSCCCYCCIYKRQNSCSVNSSVSCSYSCCYICSILMLKAVLAAAVLY